MDNILNDYHRSVEFCVNEIKILHDELRQILRKQDLIEVKLKIFMKHESGLAARALIPQETVTRVEEEKVFIKAIIDLLNQVNCPMQIKEISDLLVKLDLIPIQILNINGYIMRRLKVACDTKVVGVFTAGAPGKKFYYLRDWINRYGSVEELIQISVAKF